MMCDMYSTSMRGRCVGRIVRWVSHAFVTSLSSGGGSSVISSFEASWVNSFLSFSILRCLRKVVSKRFRTDGQPRTPRWIAGEVLMPGWLPATRRVVALAAAARPLSSRSTAGGSDPHPSTAVHDSKRNVHRIIPRGDSPASAVLPATGHRTCPHP